jgi:hypothetical protein
MLLTQLYVCPSCWASKGSRLRRLRSLARPEGPGRAQAGGSELYMSDSQQKEQCGERWDGCKKRNRATRSPRLLSAGVRYAQREERERDMVAIYTEREQWREMVCGTGGSGVSGHVALRGHVRRP